VLRSFLITVLLVFAGSATDAAAQRTGGTALAVSAKVGGKSFETTGPGSCRHSPSASIYDVPAALWMIELAGDEDRPVKQVNLTLWRPKNGSPDQVSLALETRSSSHRLSVGGKAEPVGSGTVKLSPAAGGGRFELKGKDSKGTSIELSITCPVFAGVEAEGG
jgi:hypothetical protein